MVDSGGTFVAAYVLVAVLFGGYSLSLWSRARKVRRAEERGIDRHPEDRSDEGSPA